MFQTPRARGRPPRERGRDPSVRYPLNQTVFASDLTRSSSAPAETFARRRQQLVDRNILAPLTTLASPLSRFDDFSGTIHSPSDIVVVS